MMSGFPVSLDLMALKATLILLGAMLVAFALRRASGNSRHTLWTATTLALLALPILESNLPRLPLAWLPAAPAMEQVLDVQPVAATGASPGATNFAPGAADRLVELSDAAASVSPSTAPRGLGFWFGVAWLVGVVGFAAPVLLGLLRSRRVMAHAREVDDDRLQDHFAHARRLVGVPSPVSLRISPEVRTPMTGGMRHPVVLLPETALLWSDDCTAAVLRHELVHVRQRDALRQLGSRLSVALYWFHPLAWRAARLGALAREMACDESVLRLGTRPSRYARHLLALADPLPAPLAPALVRLDHPHLEERVMAILRASPPPASRRLSVSAAVLMLAWTAVVAAATPTVRDAAAEDRSTAASDYPVELASFAPELVGNLEMPAEEVALVDEAVALEQQADCEQTRDGRVSATRDSRGGVRMFTTTHEGTRLCLAVRGDNADREVFVPRGRLPNGVLVTMATSNTDGNRRLEIEGTSRGNVHRWYVDGRESTFDGEAAEWRDAMFELVGVLTERNAADHARALEEMSVARRNLERSRTAMGRSLEAEQHAIARAHADAEVAARVAERVEGRPVRAANALSRARTAEANARARELEVAGHGVGREAMAEVAEAHARAAADVARHMDEVAATGVGRSSGGRAMVAPRAAGGARPAIAPRAAGGRSADVSEMRAREVDAALMRNREVLDEHRRTMEQRRDEMAEHADELRAHARELAREHAEMDAEIRRTAPVIREGRGGVRMREVPVPPRAPDVPSPRALRRVPTAPAVPSIRERELDPRAREAVERLREAIRVTGET